MMCSEGRLWQEGCGVFLKTERRKKIKIIKEGHASFSFSFASL